MKMLSQDIHCQVLSTPSFNCIDEGSRNLTGPIKSATHYANPILLVLFVEFLNKDKWKDAWSLKWVEKSPSCMGWGLYMRLKKKEALIRPISPHFIYNITNCIT